MNQHQEDRPMERQAPSAVRAEEPRQNFPYGQPTGEVLPQQIVRSAFSLIGLGLFAMMAVQQMISFLVLLLAGMSAPHLEETGWFFWAASYLPLYLVAYPLMLSIWHKVPNRLPLPHPRKKLPAYSYFLLITGCFAVTYALNLVSLLLAQGISQITGSEVVNPLQAMLGAGNLWLNLLVVSIVAPLMEELIFRRFLYQKLACFGGKVYVLFSALLFAAFHVNIHQMLYAFVLGAVLAVVTYHTHSIRHAILLHMGINFLGGGGTPLVLHYTGETGAFLLNLVITLILASGIFAIVWWFYKGCPWADFEPGRYPIPSAATMIGNPGVLLYLLLTLILTVFQLIG